MHIKTILNCVEKHQSFVYGEASLIRNGSQLELEIAIRPRRNSPAVCSGCGARAPGYDTLAERRFQYPPLWGILVYFVYRMRRVNCRNCGVKVERVPWAQGKSPITTTYGWFLANWARRMSWSEVAAAFRTSWHQVYTAVQMAVEWGRRHMDLDGITAIGVDEIQWGRGHRFLTMVYQIDAGQRRLLWAGEKRTVKTLLRFFRWLGPQRSARLQFVCSDMWRAYLKVIAKKAGHAVHVLDRFHIVANLNKAIDEVRAGEARQLAREGYEPVLKRTRWTLLKRPEHLTGRQQATLTELLQYNLRTVKCYLLKEQFQLLWEYGSPYWAGRFLDGWCTSAARTRIEPLQRAARTIRKHRELILNWFRARKAFSAGAVEGLNAKAKLTTRKAYGFREFKSLQVALYHNLAKLPQPNFAHEFF